MFTSAGPIEVIQVGGMALVRLWGTGDEGAGARVGTDPAEKPELFLSAPGTEPD